MQIIFKKDDLFYSLFERINKDSSDDEIRDALFKYYELNSIEPSINIEKDIVTVQLDFDLLEKHSSAYKRAIVFCEKGKFDDAHSIIKELIKDNPRNSEYNRIEGQILFEKGQLDLAVNSLIEALKWNPKNTEALIMMGNTIIKSDNDIDSAIKYYNEVTRIEPENYIAFNNIGAVLLQSNHPEGISFIKEAYKINPKYENTLFAIALHHFNKEEYLSAFDWCLKLYAVSNKGTVFEQGIALGIEIGKKVSNLPECKKTVEKYRRKIELEAGKEIKIQEDKIISTAAKIEIAENHNRDYHMVLFNPSYPTAFHLIVHELVHLDLINQAREVNENKVFTSSSNEKNEFYKQFSVDRKKLIKRGVPEEKVKKFFSSMFTGLNLQVYNTPIDLFIEDFIYNEFQDLRPIQFLSLYTFVNEGVKATTDRQIINSVPHTVVSWSKMYNLINAIHFKNLFNMDTISQFKASGKDLNEAQAFYDEFLEYLKDRSAGEEYELIQNWADDLGLDHYFTLKNEGNLEKGNTPEDLIDRIEKDPLGLESADPFAEKEMKKFLSTHDNTELNMAVAKYMIEAIRYFKSVQQPKVKEIALEIAQLGATGIDPNKKGYRISSIPKKTFSGYHLLAYYYVSWAIAIPELLTQLQMPFDKEYALALTFKAK